MRSLIIFGALATLTLGEVAFYEIRFPFLPNWMLTRQAVLAKAALSDNDNGDWRQAIEDLTDLTIQRY